MSYAVKAVPVGALGFDCVINLNAVTAAKMAAAGMKYCVRYLGSLTAKEVSAITGAGMGVMAVCYSRAPGWAPSASVGAQDGAQMIAHAKAAGLLPGMTLWIDFEGPGGTAAEQMEYINAAADAVTAAGFIAGLYVGLSALTSAQLFSTHVHAYWKSLSNVPTPNCGFQQFQLYPSVTVGGLFVDLDVVQQDYAHRQPMMMVAA